MLQTQFDNLSPLLYEKCRALILAARHIINQKKLVCVYLQFLGRDVAVHSYLK